MRAALALACVASLEAHRQPIDTRALDLEHLEAQSVLLDDFTLAGGMTSRLIPAVETMPRRTGSRGAELIPMTPLSSA